MALTFPKAPRVKAGDSPLARQMAGLANAANVKHRCGLGDLHERLTYLCGNWARQIRNPDEFGNYPSEAEYYEIYALLNPINDIPTFPVFGPGEPEGLNLTCPPAVWAFGNETANLLDEESRLFDVNLWFHIDGPAQTLEEWWELRKQQCGVYDPTTGAQNAPAIAAARAAQNIFWNTRVPHNHTYGGFTPTPNILLNDCGTTEDTGSGIPSYEYFFTALRTGVSVPSHHGTLTTNGDGLSVITYAGSCPIGSDFYALGHVQGISRLHYYYLVFFEDGFDILTRSDWIEGPYTGEGVLRRDSAELFSRAGYAFVNDFKGTDDQRANDDFDIEKVAFGFKEFHSGQYHLAPNIGYDTGLELAPVYPRATASAAQSIAAGTFLKFDGTTSRSYTPGFFFSGCFAKASNLFEPVTLEVLSGSKVIARLTLSPSEPMALKYLSDGVFPEPLRVRLANDARFTSAGEIIFEANELYAYRPDHWDAYMLLRLSATKGGEEFAGSFLDGSGKDELNAPAIYANYARYGCVVNTAAAGVRTATTALNPNPVYDSMRRVINSLFRCVRRHELLSYGTDTQGRPVIRVKRYAFGLKNEKADIFEGIAPSYRGVSKIVEGVEYVVRSHTGGSITYNGIRYLHEKRFVGSKESTFDTDGDALLLEYEGIKPTAPKGGWSNEWVMDEEFHFYHPSSSSLWKLDSYADWYMRGNRCNTYQFSMPSALARVADNVPNPDSPLNLHLSPEVVSGYIYTQGSNSTASPDFGSSCQIYKAPYELASVTVEFSATGDDVCVLIFKEPFQRDPSAPTSIDPNPLNWSPTEVANLRAEPYRTTDNGLREYFYYIATNTHGSWKVGDAAAQSFVQSLPDNPFGSIMPRLFFTSLARIPYLDGNDTWDSTDTRITTEEFIKLEWKLKAWCEGCIDGFSTVDHICGGASLPYDFTFENLKFYAFGGTDIGLAHGPLVNTDLDANTFNQIAECLDLLTMFRVEGGIMQLEARDVNYATFADVTANFGSGSCPPTSSVHAFWEGSPPAPVFTSYGSWVPASTLPASSGAILTQCGPSGVSGILGIQSSRQDFEYRYIVAAGFENAVPQLIKDLIDNNAVGVVGTITTETSFARRRDAVDFAETSCNVGTGDGPGAFADGPTGYAWDTETHSETVCALITTGKIEAGDPPPGSFKICSYPDAGSGSGYSESTTVSLRTKTFSKIADDSVAIISVPLVDQEAAT